MDEQAMKRLRAAVGAAWWTVGLFGVYLTVAWFALLAAFHWRPVWMIDLWGGGSLTWDEMQHVSLWLFGVMKLLLWVGVLIALWLTLYVRRLGRQE